MDLSPNQQPSVRTNDALNPGMIESHIETEKQIHSHNTVTEQENTFSSKQNEQSKETSFTNRHETLQDTVSSNEQLFLNEPNKLKQIPLTKNLEEQPMMSSHKEYSTSYTDELENKDNVALQSDKLASNNSSWNEENELFHSKEGVEQIQLKNETGTTFVGAMHDTNFAVQTPSFEIFEKSKDNTATSEKSDISTESRDEVKLDQRDFESRDSREILSPLSFESTTRRRVISRDNDIRDDSTISVESGYIGDENSESKEIRVPHFERRKIFNIGKHITSNVFIVLDLIFDWVEYTEMDQRGNYSIVAERRIKNIEFTIECEGTGKEIQNIYLIFTIVATIMTVIQILNIIYQIFHEIKRTKKSKRLVHETVETFLFLLFIELSQIVLVMGFFDVCTLDCTIDKKEILIVLNCTFSFLKLSWRFLTRWRCCTLKWVDPTKRKVVNLRRPQTRTSRGRIAPYNGHQGRPSQKAVCTSCAGNIKYCFLILCFPIIVPLVIVGLPCILIYLICSNTADEDVIRDRQSTWKCEQSCKCCKIRCFPSRFEDPDTNACDCTCKKCLSCEQICKCCTLRCFPTYLDNPEEDVWECTCGRCMKCEQMCGCCILRCFSSQLDVPTSDYCTCRCAECLACECPLKCFTFRCFPEYLIPPKSEVCTCRCGDCMAFKLPCKCFTFRCFPEHLNPPHTDFWTCQCKECLSCELPCKCFIARCFPEYLSPSQSNWFDCTCGECMKCEQTCCCCILRCFPSLLNRTENCTCIFRQCTACEKNFGCFICRCFPATLDPPEPNVFDCTCGKCLSCEQDCVCCKLRCCPSYLIPNEENWCDCTCCNERQSRQVVPNTPSIQIISRPTTPVLPPVLPMPVTIQPTPSPVIPIIIPEPPRQPTPVPIPREPICKNCKSCGKEFCKKCNYCFLVLLVIVVIILLTFFSYLEAIQIRYVLVCFPNDTFMNATQSVFVQPYLKLFKL